MDNPFEWENGTIFILDEYRKLTLLNLIYFPVKPSI